MMKDNNANLQITNDKPLLARPFSGGGILFGTRLCFRTPEAGEPVHIELTLDGFTLGIATIEAAKEHHSLRPDGEGRWIEIVLWTDDTDAPVNALVARGVPLLSPPHDFLDGKLRAAWIADPDGNPIQLVQRRE
jgi:catechol 2,3-dioxygenase-like lactoylglutathione lyase family enzyme